MHQNIRMLLPLGGALIFAGTAGYIFYMLLKRDDDDDSLIEATDLSACPLAKLEVKIPCQAVGAVIGRQGSNVKAIQEFTSTSIRFRDEDENERICIIVGKIEKAEKAKEMIIKSIEDIPVMHSKEIFVPLSSVGRIIGRQGTSINAISRSSGAKIKVDNNSKRSLQSEDTDSHRIVLQGSEAQILAAEDEIQIKVKEDEQMRKKISHSASRISHRIRQKAEGVSDSNLPILMNGSEEELSLNSQHTSNGNLSEEKVIEIYVSAVESVTSFFVQVVSELTVALDKLVEDMTDYYSEKENRNLHEIENKVKNGDFIAAQFSKDACWYRGYIIGEHKHGEPFVKVYFVDFGDSEIIHMTKICRLRTDFLKLSHQAIACRLAGIDPTSVNTQECLTAFESLTYAMEWKPISMKVCGYIPQGEETIPCVKLIDNNELQQIDVAEELVARGLAKKTAVPQSIGIRDH